MSPISITTSESLAGGEGSRGRPSVHNIEKLDELGKLFYCPRGLLCERVSPRGENSHSRPVNFGSPEEAAPGGVDTTTERLTTVNLGADDHG
jgi:hypothetical protein